MVCRILGWRTIEDCWEICESCQDRRADVRGEKISNSDDIEEENDDLDILDFS